MALFVSAHKRQFPSLGYKNSIDALSGSLYLLLKRSNVRRSLIVGSLTTEERTEEIDETKTNPPKKFCR